MNEVEKVKVKKYIAENKYNWTYPQIRREYIKWRSGAYISFTAKKVINACIDENCKVYK